MLEKTTVQQFKDNGYTFEEIEGIKRGLQDIEDGNTTPFEEFWPQFCKQINDKMRENA